MKKRKPGLSRVAKALADPQRLAILREASRRGELSCTELLTRFELAQATVSHHLKELTGAGLLVRRQAGRFAYYRFVPEVLEAYTRELTASLAPPSEGRKRRAPPA